MEYFCIQDLLREMSEEELAKLTGDPTGVNINTERIKHAGKNAMAIIEAYLPKRIGIGLDPYNDPIIGKIAVDLTIVHLHEYYNTKTALPLTVLWRKTNAMKLLKDLQSGNAHLPASNPGTNAPPKIVSNKTEKNGQFRQLMDRLFED